jgi:NAD(P)-dependent dehydrogenase (short-subunit alcohol dehydrogenase family)
MSQAADEDHSPKSTLLSGKVAMITGGARGIGLEIARALAQSGAAIALNDLGCSPDGSGRDESVVEAAADELRAEGARVLSDSGDVREPVAVEKWLEAVLAELGQVDILVNNAGVVSDKNLFDLSHEAWDSVVRAHLYGSFVCTQTVARWLRKARRGGSFINMTSTSGMLGNLGQINESSAKAGIYGMTRTASIELQKYGIRVNALAAIAKTRLTSDLPMFEKVGDSLSARHIAPAAVFLASDLSSELSGTVLSVAGGRISTFELTESQGRIKEADGGIWTPQEIADHYDSIAKK